MAFRRPSKRVNPRNDNVIDKILRHDNGFDQAAFLQGARSAYAMIIKAFAAGDNTALEPLLSKEVYQTYEKAISDREKLGHVMTTEIERIVDAKIESFNQIGNIGQIYVTFTAEITSETKDGDGKTVEGDLQFIKFVEEVWGFEKDRLDKSPTWRLCEVERKG